MSSRRGDPGDPVGRCRSRRWRTLPSAVVLAAILITAVPTSTPAIAASPGAAFSPLAPCRLLDTRDAGVRLAAGSTTRIQVAGRCGVDPAAIAASLVVTAVGSLGSGHVTVFAPGNGRPTASNLNFDASTTISNSAISELGGGAVEVFVSRSTHLVLDVGGSFVSADGPVAAGRYVPHGPVRLLDTRRTGQRGAADLAVPLPSAARGATALAVTLTIVNSSRAGHLSVRRSGDARTLSSVGNVDRLDRTRAITTFVPVSADGFVIFRSMPTDVVVDMSGWFTGPTSASSTDGLFVAQRAERVLDSRTAGRAIHPGGTIEHDFRVGRAAVVANVTALGTVRPGWVSAYPAGTPRPPTSLINARWRRPIANLGVVPLSVRGAAFHANTGTQLLIDVVGWFSGAPQDAPNPPASNAMSVSGGRVLIVSDSAFAGIRWYGKLDHLVGASYVADLESCRRLIGASCRGRTGYVPPNGVQAILDAPGRFDTLVVTAGYNDRAEAFPAAIDQIVAAARARGIRRVVWLDYRDAVGYVAPGGASASTFLSHSHRLREAAAGRQYPELEVLNWNDYATGRLGWFGGDLLHQTPQGAEMAADFISRSLAQLERRACPAGGPSTTGGWCAVPS